MSATCVGRRRGEKGREGARRGEKVKVVRRSKMSATRVRLRLRARAGGRVREDARFGPSSRAHARRAGCPRRRPPRGSSRRRGRTCARRSPGGGGGAERHEQAHAGQPDAHEHATCCACTGVAAAPPRHLEELVEEELLALGLDVHAEDHVVEARDRDVVRRQRAPQLRLPARAVGRRRRLGGRRQLDLKLGQPHERARLDLHAVHDVVLRPRGEEDEARDVRVERPRHRVRDRLHQLQALPLGQHQVEFDARARRDDKVGDGRAGPVEGEDAPAPLAAAALARVRERGARLLQIHEVELGVRALHRGEAVVEREAHVLHRAAGFDDERRRRLVEGQRHELAVLDEDEPARRLVEAHLRVLLVELEHRAQAHVCRRRVLGRRVARPRGLRDWLSPWCVARRGHGRRVGERSHCTEMRASSSEGSWSSATAASSRRSSSASKSLSLARSLVSVPGAAPLGQAKGPLPARVGGPLIRHA